MGFASFHARALVNRGRAHQGLGRFEEALVDFTAAREIYDRVGSPSVAYPLVREGIAPPAARRPAAGEVRLRDRDPRGPRRRATPRPWPRRSSASPRRSSPTTRIAPASSRPSRSSSDAAWRRSPCSSARPASHVALGELDAGRRLAREATNVAAARQDQPGYASGLEIQAQTTASRRARPSCCAIGRPRSGPPPASPMATPATGSSSPRSSTATAPRAAAEDAAGVFRSLGARGPATEAAERLETLDRAGRPALEIGAARAGSGVLRDGEPIPPTAWQSKKARDLLKILVARRGRPTTRETLFEVLWPDEDPEPLGNRLSVALATMRVRARSREAVRDRLVRRRRQAGGVARPRRTSTSTSRRSWPPRPTACACSARASAGSARRALEAAEGRYGGDFLEEDPYEDWAVGLREEAQAAYISVTRLLADGRGGRPATPTARPATSSGSSSATPYDEAAHLGLVGALLAAGRHGEARRRYGIYATEMEEMGVEAAPFPSARARRARRGASR